jgi:(p)ppGpp synthase/HD superfamily hydrolase
MAVSAKLLKAIELSLDAHKGQIRKFSGKPYISHPFRVLNRLKRFGVKDEDVLVATVAHDTMEDTKVT